MSEKDTFEDFEFPEFIEEKTSYLDKLKHIKEVGVFPQELVILPNEWMTLKVTDANYQKLLADAMNDEAYLGIVPQLKDGTLPPVGSIGVGADVEDINPMLGKTHIVKIRGVVRFTIDEYVETDKPYPMAQVTFFEDDEKEKPGEKELRAQLLNELRELIGEYNRNHGKYPHLGDFNHYIEDKYLETLSFFFWTMCFSPIPAQIREIVLKIRSTVQRTFILNRQLPRTLKKLDKIKQSRSN